MDELKHYGILGMKWGVRRFQNPDGTLTPAGKERYRKWNYKNRQINIKTKNGETISLLEKPDPQIAKFLGKIFKGVRNNLENTANYSIKDKDGKTVGDLTLFKEAKDSINVVWIETKGSARGRGYGTAAMKAVIKIAKDAGAKKVTLEVPGISPDARHIYEKLGFKEVPSPNKDPDDIWGGLTNMVLDLSEINHTSIKESRIEPIDDLKHRFLKYLLKEIEEIGDIEHMEKDIIHDTLKHYGILGMKWGVRRFQNPDGTLTPEGKKRYYKPTKRDILLYGQKGAQRIADRRNRGMDRSKAVRREVARQVGIGVGTLAAAATVGYLTISPDGKKLFQKGKEKIKSLWNKYYNVQILDTTGKVIAKYHEKIKYGEAIVSGLLGA